MNRYLAGFLGGLIGGFVRLGSERIAFASNLTNVNMIRIMDRLIPGITPGLGWVIHGLMAGLVGLVVALIVPKYYPKSYWTAGIVIGLILWGAMNLLFIVFGITTPSWALGFGSLIIDLVTHWALGIIIAYALWLSRIKVTNQEEVK